MLRSGIILIIFFLSLSCAKKEEIYKPTAKLDPYLLYQEGLDAFEKNDFFFANKKFSEAEINFEVSDYAAKSAIMACFSLYGINFYDEAETNLERYLQTYPADINVQYAHYLLAIIYFEQIEDEKKDLQPLIKARDKIDFFLKNYKNSEYAVDLKFKKDLILNQLAAKELYVAKYYISVQKWVAAINRLKIIISEYDKTIFVEEALHRLVEIHYYLGLEKQANDYAKILGYNYNSSEWFKQSYKILNQEYEFQKTKIIEKDSFLKKVLNKIKIL